jgi:C4-type Zn-finger protein
MREDFALVCVPEDGVIATGNHGLPVAWNVEGILKHINTKLKFAVRNVLWLPGGAVVKNNSI